MKKAILCIGVDAFDSRDISPLAGAATDARRWAAFFEHRLGYLARVVTHEELRNGVRIFDVLDELLSHAGEPGDMLGVFIATHGKQMPLPNGGFDQLFLLPHARLKSLNSGHLGEGALSFRQLATESARPGLQRFFVIDACRAPLTAPTSSRDASASFAALGQVVYRDPLLNVVPDHQAASPLLVLNACADQQRAGELRSVRRGLFSMAAEEVAVSRLDSGEKLVLDTSFVTKVGTRMRQLALAQSQDEMVAQDPVIDQGEPLCLWSPDDPTASHQQRFLDEFQQQLHDGKLDEPYGDCARDTLTRLQGLHLPSLRHKELFEQLVLARKQAREAADREHDNDLMGQASKMNTAAAWSRVAIVARLPVSRARAQLFATELSTPLTDLAEKTSVQLQPGQVFRDADWAPEMVVIPAGQYMMGSPSSEPGRSGREGPQRRVSVKGFAMGKAPVTQGQWKAVMGSNPSHFKACGDSCPVEKVSWDEVQKYLQALNQKVGLSGAVGYRLPSEAEWEYAARAGSQGRWCFGDDERQLAGYAWYDDNSDRETHPVCQKKPNAFGLHDMHGNVWEWVQDCYEVDYSKGQPTDGGAHRGGGSSCSHRVLRGSSWYDFPQNLRSAYRGWNSPGGRNNFNGFRIARTVP